MIYFPWFVVGWCSFFTFACVVKKDIKGILFGLSLILMNIVVALKNMGVI